jgi:hypothetical protein
MRVAVAAVVMCLLVGCSLSDEDEPSSATKANFVSDLIRLGKDEQYGVVGLVRAGEKTRVLIEVVDPPSDQQSAEIRRGNCHVLDGATVYRLKTVVEGSSETIVDVPLSHLRRTGYAVLVGVPSPHIASLCGDLYRSKPPNAAPTFD